MSRIDISYIERTHEPDLILVQGIDQGNDPPGHVRQIADGRERILANGVQLVAILHHASTERREIAGGDRVDQFGEAARYGRGGAILQQVAGLHRSLRRDYTNTGIQIRVK